MCVCTVGDGQHGDGEAAPVSGERNAASSEGQEDGEEESLVCCESLSAAVLSWSPGTTRWTMCVVF